MRIAIGSDHRGVNAKARLAAMLRHKPDRNESDGSKRLFAVACRAVGHDLSDAAAVAAIRQYEQTHAFPREWSDADILRRLRDAEKKTDRGSAIAAMRSRWKVASPNISSEALARL